MNLLLVTALLFGSSALTSRLYAASYAGTVTSLSLSRPGADYRLTTVSQTDNCGNSPSWLMLDGTNEILYCLDEGIGLPNSTLTSFKIKSNGSLAKIHQLQTLTGPVASVFYSATQLTDRKFFAVVHYSGSAVTTYSVDPTRGHFEHCQTFTFTIPAPGTVPSRQEASHPHGVVVDPTGQFVLVPDLGADLVRIFQVNPTTGGLEEQEPFAVAPGSGPRHAVFWTPSRVRQAQLRDVRFYLVSELDNHLRGYDVKYSQNGTISFSQFYDANTYGGATPPTGSKAAEIAISVSDSYDPPRALER
ncbi:hypothetical protein EYZ11_009544 [Aspergillus tanneri]|uniref:Uncharacterized protein n=1 Tax=Aspergillus tanneri TaxID=1220188 RepID=A0A4S3J843_9EURO|nr:hypothetical protein EYZ11_009544 [Aspergillus tanneri]